jgi:hypothetical protein
VFLISLPSNILHGIAPNSPEALEENKYERISFRMLRVYIPGTEPPESVKELDGKRIEILGFMSSLTQLDDIDEFVLASAPPMNCFCHPPGSVNSMIYVVMNDGKTTEYRSGVMKVRGTLRVNFDVQDEFSDVMYTIECDEVK